LKFAKPVNVGCEGAVFGELVDGGRVDSWLGRKGDYIPMGE
jgi:hypothetical protein